MMAADTTLVILATLLVPTLGGCSLVNCTAAFLEAAPIPLPTPSLPSRPAEVASPPRLVRSRG